MLERSLLRCLMLQRGFCRSSCRLVQIPAKSRWRNGAKRKRAVQWPRKRKRRGVQWMVAGCAAGSGGIPAVNSAMARSGDCRLRRRQPFALRTAAPQQRRFPCSSSSPAIWTAPCSTRTSACPTARTSSFCACERRAYGSRPRRGGASTRCASCSSPSWTAWDFVASNGAQVIVEGELVDLEVFSHAAVKRLARVVDLFDTMHLALFDETRSYLLDDEGALRARGGQEPAESCARVWRCRRPR